MNKCAKFHGDSPKGKKVISRARLNFRRRPILCTTLYRTLCKRTTSVAHLTNFSFEFIYAILTEDTSLHCLHHGAIKSKMTKNSNQGGPALKQLSTAWSLGDQVEYNK